MLFFLPIQWLLSDNVNPQSWSPLPGGYGLDIDKTFSKIVTSDNSLKALEALVRNLSGRGLMVLSL